MVIIIPCAILLCLLLALIAAGAGRFTRRRSSVPPGRILYSDTLPGRRPSRTFVSLRYGLKGRPDYIVETSEGIIPIEVKSGFRPSTSRPYDSHLMQLACYWLLLEENYREPVLFGVIRYRDGEIRVPFTPHLRRRLLALLDEIQAARDGQTPVRRNHSHHRRCQACGFRDLCEQALG